MKHFSAHYVSRIGLATTFIPAAALGCSSHSGPHVAPSIAESTIALEGEVHNAAGKPIVGALVSISAHFDLLALDPALDVFSDAQGRFRFVSVPPGSYGLTVTHPDYTAKYGGVWELPRQTRPAVDLRMNTAGFTVEGFVRDEHDNPLANARLQAPALSENEHEVYVTRTDAQGHYVLRLPAEYGYFVVADVRPRPRAHAQIEPKDQHIDLRLEPPPAPRPPDEAILAWLRKNATPLEGDRDMNEKGAAAFRSIVGNAPLVALGESTHGSGEFTKWRRRVFQALVRDAGFTVYAIEGGVAEAFALDEYVVHGRGDLRAAVHALGGWKDETEETLAFAQWMREYNANPAHDNKLHFVGFDPLAWNAVSELMAYLRKVDAAEAASAEKNLAPLSQITAESTYSALPADVQRKTRNDVDALMQRMDEKRATYVSRSNDAEWLRARHLARVIQQAEVAYRDYAARDEFMFENVQWLVDHSAPGTKFVLDAHNAHIAAGGHSLVYLGRRLREKWGSSYVAIGFAFGAGSFLALDWREKPTNELGPFALDHAKPGTFDGDLSLGNLGDFVVPLHSAEGAIAAWLRSPQDMHHVGGRFLGAERSFEQYVPARDFDAIIYLDHISPVHRFVMSRQIGSDTGHPVGSEL